MSTGHWWLDTLAVAGIAVVFGIPAVFGVWRLVDLWRGRNRPQHRREKEETVPETVVPS
jgi:hypothetical protein